VADRRPTIALVEDNPDNRMLVEAILDGAYEIVEYESGIAALEGLRDLVPDLILMDISLPEMDGSEVLRRLRQDERFGSVPVVALTAHAMAGDRERFLSQGFDDYVTKPIVDDSLLLGAIERGLSPER
jgi:CheY-like chemotaxis protein